MSSATFCLLLAAITPTADPITVKDALRPFNLFVGKWKGTGVPDARGGSRVKEFWSETIEWIWQFKDNDACLFGQFDKNPTYATIELRFLTKTQQYEMTLTTHAKTKEVYLGELKPGKGKEQVLTLDRTDDATQTVQRFVFTLLHHNRYLYRLETKPIKAASFSRSYQVGVTKEGESFASVPTGPECIVSGGTGSSRVTYKGETYYVCCSGCRDAFKENPEKFIKEFEEKKKKESKKE